jgi:acyl-CoA synthetase (NDP forming)
MASEMEVFFNPSSAAVAGASKSGMKLGNVTIANMLRFDYQGSIYPIHPEGGELMGLKAYPSLKAVGNKIDVAVGVLPREQTLEFIEECADANIRSVIICAAGFADAGPEGAALQEEVVDAVRRRNMRMLGPNSVGTVSTESGFATSLMTLQPVKQGKISIVAQTGLFAGGFARWISSTQAFGLSKLVSMGNKADIDEIDMLGYLEKDPHTGVIALYSEGIGDGRSFKEMAARISRTKPIVMLKGGRTELGGRMASSHTGSMAGEDGIYRGVCAQAGIIPVDSIEELFDCSKALAYCPLPAGPNMGVVSISGAGTVLSADACNRRGLKLPPLKEESLGEDRKRLPDWMAVNNPMDIWVAAITENVGGAYDVFLNAMARQEDIHMILAAFTIVPESEFEAVEVFRAVKERHPDKPILAAFLGASQEDHRRWFNWLEGIDIPVFDSIERGVNAAWALSRYAAWRRRE